MDTGQAAAGSGVLAPIAETGGYSKATFGIVTILDLETGCLTPPVRPNLTVATEAGMWCHFCRKR